MRLLVDRVRSPLGELLLVVAPDAPGGPALAALDFADREDRLRALLQRRLGGGAPEPARHGTRLARRARAWLGGVLEAWEGVPLLLRGTPFQTQVWAALCDIPPGCTATYTGLARGLGLPRAARAVGRAVATNPVALAVPCHRVVGASGALTGYAGGLARKRWLLAHEQRPAERAGFPAAGQLAAGV